MSELVPPPARAGFILLESVVNCPKSRPNRLEHDPEKWKPVFRKDHAPLKKNFGGLAE